MRPLRVRLPGDLPPAAAALLLRGDAHPRALVGDWAGVGAVLAGEPRELAPDDADPFGLLGAQPALDGDGVAVGGGWIGALRYGLAAAVEPVPPPPPRPVPLPLASLAFYDHAVVRDEAGRWWFEALWTPERAATLDERLRTWRARFAAPAPQPAGFDAGLLALAPPGAAGHRAAVAEAIERIAAGEVFQVNLCLRLEGEWRSGDPLDLFARAAAALGPRHAAFAAGPWGAICSLSPERFLRRAGRAVLTEPIKGTGADPVALARSAKDRAENIMIADLMRNDLGRVCEYGSVRADALAVVRPGPGVHHLVSSVRGTLREEATDADLLRATFPPGSCTGAPKVQAMRVVHELEATGREAYTGAIGIASPVAGLDLNVAIRTFEIAGGRIWLGAGGGIVSDSEPGAELAEALAKAAAPARAAGLTVLAPGGGAGTPAPVAAAAGGERPDPARGLLETLRVAAGEPQHLDAHLRRLRASAAVLGLAVPGDLPARVTDAARRIGHGRARIVLDRAGARVSAREEPSAGGELVLRPFVLPGGLGPHKWADRRLVDALAAACGGVPLLVDGDGAVLEAAWASVVAADGRTPPADGRILAGVTRARALAAGLVREAPLRLADLAPGAVLLSSVGGPRAARLGDGAAPTAFAAALREPLGFGNAAFVGHTG